MPNFPCARQFILQVSLPVCLPVCLLACLVLSGLTAACGQGREEPVGITVFAAASLTDAFQEIARGFERENPGVEVKLNFAGSQRLRTQLELGARADVFASADISQMRLAQDSGLIAGEQQFFTSAPLAVIASVESNVLALGDLAEPGVKLVLGHESVPVGQYSRLLLQRLSQPGAGIGEDFAIRALENVVSEETSVKSVEQKVVLGQADAGIVYRPGARTATSTGAVRELPLPQTVDGVLANFPIARLHNAPNPAWAGKFIDYVLSVDAQDALAGHGFESP